ncbi:MAG: hypothetical protein PHX50_17645 [Massilibacteroides sp.]|nr:hypothetical protein [Massilibacteroides sp.]
MVTPTKKLSRPLSKEEGFGFIEDFLRSRMSGIDYYQSHEISEWQFYKWKRLYLEEHPGSSAAYQENNTARGKPSLLHPLEIAHAPGSEVPCMPAFDIYYPGGTRLRVEEGLRDVSVLERLLMNR